MSLAILTILIFIFIVGSWLNEKDKTNTMNHYADKYQERMKDEERRKLKGRNKLLEEIEAVRIAKSVYYSYDKYMDYVLDKEQQKQYSTSRGIAIDYFIDTFLRGKNIQEYIRVHTGKLALQWGYMPRIEYMIPKESIDENGVINSDFLWEIKQSSIGFENSIYYKEEDEEKRKKYFNELIERATEEQIQDALASKIAEPFEMEIPLTDEELKKAREIVQAKIKEHDDLLEAISK